MFDAHGHITNEHLTNFADELIFHLQSGGLESLILGGVDSADWQRQFVLAKKYPEFLSPIIGIHPWVVRDSTNEMLETMLTELRMISQNVKAFGEIGLDFYGDQSQAQRDHQTKWCRRQLELAEELRKPVVLHVVKGHDVMQAMLKDFKLPCAMIHGFRGNSQVARFYLERGYILSLGPRSFMKLSPHDYSWLPKSGFVIESDAPNHRLLETLTKGEVLVQDVAHEWVRALEDTASFIGKALHLDVQEVWKHARANIERFLTM